MFKTLGLVALVGIVLAAIGAYIALRPTAPSSSPLQAVPLQSDSSDQSAAEATLSVFEIKPGASHAGFVVDEILRGNPNTVVGTTDQVAGQMAVNPTQPPTAQVGTILIDARSLATDDSQRNNAIRRFILGTDQYEYISFTPTVLHGLPASASLGQPYSFQITGDLTIKDVTQEATFDATVTPVSASELNGSAATTIRYGDWNISVPDVPFVAGVADTLQLQLPSFGPK
jgi:polyisoprenoid-binding protein YceI